MLAAMPPPASSPSASGENSPRTRGDACPGSLRLHRADDGALARVRLPGGIVTAEQADVLGELAGRLGEGDIHLTSRGNAQLRALPADCGGELALRLGESGLLPSARHERVRNLVASPLSGLDGLGHADVGPWLAELDALLCASERAVSLSGRFLFALDDGRGDVDALGADVTLLAQDNGDALLRVGAAADAVRVPGARAAHAALVAAETFLDSAPDAGTWRIAELPQGPDALLAQVVRKLGAPLAPAPVPPHEAAAPAPGVVTGHTAALVVGAPLGRITAAQWRLLADTARRAGDNTLRLTPWRGVVVPGVAPERAAALLAALSAAGLITGPDSPWSGVGACIGRPGCAKSLSDVRALAGAAVGPVGALPVYWSGCARRCGHPHGDRVDVVATPEGHEVSVVRGESRTAPVVVASPALPAAVAAARA
ncbi:precorrin-3B synthase [Streptomyces spiroverticillatus]|uniref:Precorrin-3B synthase n=1 Tax=Streptomyces finlayi TaxID=67296 RepID=A0A918X3D3_9ACTN|nr:precorrin-3B synthase [Streptomyces finlayi]GHA27048.1 precorrin-3B synthase [Streptomyces spiroverticillatus]GHD08322.1 precorrin-3B synthase [Streptomyces finlayi]